MELREILEKKQVEVYVRRCIKENGTFFFYITSIFQFRNYNIFIKHELDTFYTLKDLKKYYNIKKITKTDEIEKVCSLKGKVYSWHVYKAKISTYFLIFP